MGKSLLFRVGVLYFILLISNITVMVVMVFENQVDLIAQNAILNSRLIGLQFRDTFRGETLSQPDEELLRSYNVSSFQVYAGDGQPITEQWGTEVRRSEQKRTTEIHAALTRRDFENRSFHHVLDYDNRRLDLYVPIESTRLRERVIVASIEMTSIDRQLGYLYRQSLILGFMVLLLHLLYAWYLWYTVLRPLKKILRGTEEVARGTLDVRITIPERNELGQMARAFNEMSVAVVRMQNEAKSSNPLTELPGNPVIAERLSKDIDRPIAVLYIDLDNFKAFNDHYGFTRGDEALLYTRDTLVQSADSFPGTFVGHQGGDDFVIVATLSQGIPLAEEIIREFDAHKAHLFDPNDMKRGYIVGVDRTGSEQRFPLLSISIAIVTTEHRKFSHPGEIAGIAAEIKQQVKKVEGSAWLSDLRRDTAEEWTDLSHEEGDR